MKEKKSTPKGKMAAPAKTQSRRKPSPPNSAAPFAQWLPYFTGKLSEQRKIQRCRLSEQRERNQRLNAEGASAIHHLRRVISEGDTNAIKSAMKDLFRYFERIRVERVPRSKQAALGKKSSANEERSPHYNPWFAHGYLIHDSEGETRKPTLAERVQLEHEIFIACQILRTLDERHGRFFGKTSLPDARFSQGTILDSLDLGLVGKLLRALLDRDPEPFDRVSSVLKAIQKAASQREPKDKLSTRRAAILAVTELSSERFRSLVDEDKEPLPPITLPLIEERTEEIYRKHEAARTGVEPHKINYPVVDWSKLRRELRLNEDFPGRGVSRIRKNR